MKMLHMVSFVLLAIGGLNWGLTAFDLNLVEKLLGGIPYAPKVVYLLVGLAAVYEIATHKGSCKVCSAGGAPMQNVA